MPSIVARSCSIERRNELFHQNLPLAHWTLSHLFHQHPSLKVRLQRRHQREDLQQLALIALLKSCAVWDPDRGALATLLLTTLRRDLLQAARELHNRLPQCMLSEAVEAGLAAPAADLSAADGENIARALGRLDVPARLLVFRRFGFDGGREWPLDKIAALLGVSKDRVRQLERQALQQLALELGEPGVARAGSPPILNPRSRFRLLMHRAGLTILFTRDSSIQEPTLRKA